MNKEEHFGSDRYLRVVPRAMLAAAATFAGSQASAAAVDPQLALPVTSPPSDPTALPTLQVISDGRTGCTQNIAASADGLLPAQCAFDSSAFGTRIDSHIDTDTITLDSYGLAAGTIGGLWTADQLLGTRQQRFAGRGNLLVFGMKGSLLDDRLTFSTESAWSQNRYIVFQTSTGPAGMSEEQGHSNSLKVEFKLIDSPKFKWSISGNYNSVSSGYSTGRSSSLMNYFALPGTRSGISTNLRVDQVSISALLDDYRTSFGQTNSQRASVSVHGVTLTFSKRSTGTTADQRISLAQSRTESNGLYVDVDMNSVRDELLPQLGKLGAAMPVSLSIYLQSSQAQTQLSGATQSYDRSSIETSASWQTPAGDTDLDYMWQRRVGLTGGISDRTDEYLQLSHSVRWHNWRFGVDGMFSTGSSAGTRGSRDKSFSLGGSVSYFVADGPQFRLQVGQDRSASRLNDDSFASTEHYSSITGSLDLSRYLQRRFERNDLHLTVDYRRALNHDNSTNLLFGDIVERLYDGYDRSGFLVSFGMKL